MKIVINGYAGAQIVIMVVQVLGPETLQVLSREQVWYSDFISTIKRLREQFPSIEEIMVTGQMTFIEGLAKQLAEVYENDDDLKIIIIGDNVEQFSNDKIIINSNEDSKLVGHKTLESGLII